MLSLMKATSTVASNNLTWVRHSSAPACVLPYLSPKEAVLGWWSFMQNSAHADVGPCPKVHACGTLHSTSYGYRWKFPGAWACRNTLNYPPLKRYIQRLKFYDKTLWLFLRIAPSSAHKCHILWARELGTLAEIPIFTGEPIKEFGTVWWVLLRYIGILVCL